MKKFIKPLIILISFILIISFVFLGIYIKNYFTKHISHIYPKNEQINISLILDKNTLTEEDYKTLFYQTGLGKIAIDTLKKDKTTYKESLLTFQENFFKKINIKSTMITPITYAENIIDEDGFSTVGTTIAHIDNGYIIVARATHSLGWRHGHAAIVIDKKNGLTLEAAVLGQNSQKSDVRNWEYSPNFMILKLKNVPQETNDNIASYAENILYQIPYRLTAGFFGNKYKKGSLPSGTHCSHLVWYPFMEFGYDIDSSGGWIVTPQDIANSPLLEIVQIYGFDPETLWD